MFPKLGKTFSDDDERLVDRVKYQMVISAALKRELGGSHRAVKTVMRWTSVSERTAKNWIGGTHGPAGQHLIQLMRHSDQVLGVVLSLSGRDACKTTIELAEVRSALLRMIEVADQALQS